MSNVVSLADARKKRQESNLINEMGFQKTFVVNAGGDMKTAMLELEQLTNRIFKADREWPTLPTVQEREKGLIAVTELKFEYHRKLEGFKKQFQLLDF